MLNDLFVFEKQRTGREATSFYLFYWLLGVVITSTGLFVGSGWSFQEGFAEDLWIGPYYFAMAFSLMLAFLVLGKKNKLRNPRLAILALLSGVGAYLLGALVGLIPVAYLTTTEIE
ncbi:MAG: hypothetical protein OXG90_07505 [Gammaproteobacteria bacterium]|nr:hypothetical protein [Gammaproteobacteria bacterium]